MIDLTDLQKQQIADFTLVMVIIAIILTIVISYIEQKRKYKIWGIE